MKGQNFIYVLFVLMCIIACDLERIEGPQSFVCGQPFLDPRDGKMYSTVWIAEDGSHDTTKVGKCWMAENLNFEPANLGSSCYLQLPILCDTFGQMYNELKLDNICMPGWHMATKEEWKNLFKNYNWVEGFTSLGSTFTGSASTFLSGGNSNLNFLLGGFCEDVNDCQGLDDNTIFWATDKNAYVFFRDQGSANVWTRDALPGASEASYYVRCIKD